MITFDKKALSFSYFSTLVFFRFPELLPYHGPQEQDQLSEEFLDYQLMDIPMPQDPATFDIEAFSENMTSLKNRVRNIQHTHIDMSNLITVTKYLGV